MEFHADVYCVRTHELSTYETVRGNCNRVEQRSNERLHYVQWQFCAVELCRSARTHAGESARTLLRMTTLVGVGFHHGKALSIPLGVALALLPRVSGSTHENTTSAPLIRTLQQPSVHRQAKLQ